MDNKEFFYAFFVGLMDGDGSIQVNHWRKRSLQYRLIIKLKYTVWNKEMLINISKYVGGNVRNIKDKDIIWVVNKKEEVERIIKIFDTYPLITSRKICQLNFLKKSLANPSIDLYFKNRENKYINQKFNEDTLKSIFNTPIFKGWLSGFIEAEGCFSIRKNQNHSFNIGQNYDKKLLLIIKEYFKATNMVRNPNKNFYLFEVYKKKVLLEIINHIDKYPLLGEKKINFIKWKKEILSCK